jgi:3-oxoacyl-[acyl-carrier-protein] synthase II
LTRRRVVITGLGIVSPVGNTVEEAWQNILAGRSGIAHVTKFDASTFPAQIAGEVKNFDITDYISAKDARRMDTFIHFGMAAGIQAVRDAGLDKENAADLERVGVAIGSGIGGLPLIEETKEEYLAGGIRKVSPFFVPGSIINMISGNLSIMFGFKGPNIAHVSACTTGTHSIGEASRIIEYGDADVMIAGGAESTVSPLGMGAFVPHAPCRPGMMIRQRPVDRGTRIVMDLYWVRALVSWFSKSTNMPRLVAPRFMLSWLATV